MRKMIFQRLILSLVVLFLYLTEGYTIQTIPKVISFSKNDYGAASQNWNIAQDSSGIIYFGNNEGLLQFDGSRWLLYPLPSHTVIRSVAIDKNNRIYTGSYEEFGYWETLADGNLVYHSLIGYLKNYQFSNDEIWRICIIDNKVYFQSFSAYFVFDGKNVVAYKTAVNILFFLETNNVIYTQGINAGLYKIVNDSMVGIPNSDFLKDDLIRAAFSVDSNSILFGTASHGLYIYNIKENTFARWKTEADNILISGQVNCGILTRDSVYCFGTIGNGVVAIDREGKKLWHFSKSHLLSTNTALYLFNDKQNNIWVALDKGLAYVHNNSPVRFIYGKDDNIELVYNAILFDNHIYLGTNQGLYSLKESNRNNFFRYIPQTRGQVWQFSVIDNQLICSHNEGTFRVEGDHVVRISSVNGFSSLKMLTENNHEFLIQGTYTNLVIYKKNSDGRWVFSHIVNGFTNPIRFLEVDHLGNIWASHLVKGLFRIKLNKDLTEVVESKTYGTASGFPNERRINVFKVSGRIVFCTGNDFYTYDDLKDQIVPFTWLNRKSGEFSSSRLIYRADENRYWFVKKGKFGLFEIINDSVRLIDVIPFSDLNNNLIDEFEFVATLGKDKYLFCLDNGIAVYDRSRISLQDTFAPSVLFRQIKFMSNRRSILLPLHTSEKSGVKIPYSFRHSEFSFAFPELSGKRMVFVCSLRTGKSVLSDTIQEPVQMYDYLRVGQHMLEVNAYDENGHKLAGAGYYFEILPPFYATTLAKIVYILVFIFILYLSWIVLQIPVRKQNEKVLAEQARIQKEQMERKEQKIVLLKNEKLEAELIHKSKELASSTMAIIRKNDTLIQLKQEVEAQKQKLGSQYPNKYFDCLIRLIDANISSDDDWQIFQKNFDLIHEDFFRHITKKYPELTLHDLKLCAYLRLNLSTKEVSSLLNISVRGVEASRYRLRRKFSLDPDKNLVEFLINQGST